MHIQVVTFQLEGLSGEDYLAACNQLAPAIAQVPGLIRKTFIANPETNTYGGVGEPLVIIWINASGATAAYSLQRDWDYASPGSWSRSTLRAHKGSGTVKPSLPSHPLRAATSWTGRRGAIPHRPSG